MKSTVLVLAVLIAFVFSSCKKEHGKCNKKSKAEYSGICSDNSFEDLGNIPSDVRVYIVKPIVQDDLSGCIVEGVLKYVKNNKTIAMVDYGKDKDPEWAIKTICHDGKCETDKAKWCKFRQNCRPKQ